MSGHAVLEVSCLDGWRGQWDDLVLGSPVPSPFLRSWWIEGVSRSEPQFTLVVDGDTLLGGVALERKRVGPLHVWSFPGPLALAPDHLDLVALPDMVDHVSAELRKAWISRRMLVDLAGIREGSVIERCFDGRPARRLDVAPYLSLPDTVEAIHARLGRQFLHTLRRHTRRLEKEGMTYRSVTGTLEIDRALADLRRLHVLRWGDRSDFVPVFEDFARAVRLGAARGEVIFHELAVGNEVIATSVVFTVGARTSSYQSGRLQDRLFRGSGTILLVHAFEHAITSGCNEFDFLRGNETYKADFAMNARVICRKIGHVGSAAGLLATLWDAALGGRARAERQAKRLLGRSDVSSGALLSLDPPPEYSAADGATASSA